MDDIMTLSQAAHYLRLRSKRTLAQLALANKVPGGKIGKQWRFSMAALKKFLSVPEEDRTSNLTRRHPPA